jgi:hypothetical protein
MSSYSSIIRGKSSSEPAEEEKNGEKVIETPSPESESESAPVPDNTDTLPTREDEETQSLSVYGHAIGKTSSFLSWLLLIIWNKIVKRFYKMNFIYIYIYIYINCIIMLFIMISAELYLKFGN